MALFRQSLKGSRVAMLLFAVLLGAALVQATAAPAAAADPVLNLRITGAGQVTEITPAGRMECRSHATTPTGQRGNDCAVAFGWGWIVELKALPAEGFTFGGWQGVGSKPVHCDGADANHFRGAGTCKFQIWETLGLEARFVDTEAPDTVIVDRPEALINYRDVRFEFHSWQPGTRFECGFYGTWHPCNPRPTFDMTDGQHTLSVRAIDPSQNVDPTPARWSFWVDTLAPTGTLVVNGDAASTRRADVELTITARDPTRLAGGEPSGLDAMLVCNEFACGDWLPFAGTKSWTLPPGDGPKTVRVVLRDKAGNRTEFIADTILLDTTAPSGTVAINGGAATTPTRAVTLTLTATDPNDGGVAALRVRNAGTTAWSAWQPFAATEAWTLAPGAGQKTVIVQFRDRAGNLSAPAADGIAFRPGAAKQAGSVEAEPAAARPPAKASAQPGAASQAADASQRDEEQTRGRPGARDRTEG